jgi:hypothetical protein
MGANQPAAGYVDQINTATAYLDQNLQTSLGSSAGPRSTSRLSPGDLSSHPEGAVS